MFAGDSDNLDLVEVYDPATDQWGINGRRDPIGRSGGCYGVYNGKIYTGGGELKTSVFAGAYKVFESYDPATNAWETLAPAPIQRHGCTGAFIGNKLHFVGAISSRPISTAFPVAPAEHDVYTVPDGK